MSQNQLSNDYEFSDTKSCHINTFLQKLQLLLLYFSSKAKRCYNREQTCDNELISKKAVYPSTARSDLAKEVKNNTSSNDLDKTNFDTFDPHTRGCQF